MSDQVFEQYVDVYGNISVRVSQDIVVLTREDADRLMARFDQLKAENARLREQIHWLKQGDILHVLTDQEYIDQCERERLMQVSIDALDKENAKMRELAHLVAEYTSEDQCEGCVAKRACIEGELDMCWLRKKILEKLRELGVEVD